MANEALLDRLADVYQQAFSRVQIAAEQAAQDAWYSFDSFAGEDEDEWNAAYWAIVSAATLTATGLAVSYLQYQFDAEGIDFIVPTPDLDWLEDDFDVWKQSPMVASRIGISKGMDPVEAMTAGATRVTRHTGTIVREAEQRAIEDFFEELSDIDVEVTYTEVDAPTTAKPKKVRSKYRRIVQSGSCGWCRVAADRLYGERAKRDHPLGAWHEYCRCTWRKVTASEAAAWEQRLAGGQWRSVVKERATVSETGE
jgi:hypothetical protein